MTTGTARGLKKTKRVVYSDWKKFKSLNHAQLSADAVRELETTKAVTPMDGIDTVQVDADILLELKTKMQANKTIVGLSEAKERQIAEIKRLELRKKNIGALGMSQDFLDTVAALDPARKGLETIDAALVVAYKAAGREGELDSE
jgi:hypothetical protein